MRNLLVMAVIAIGFGALAVWGMRVWIEGQRVPVETAAVEEVRPVSTIVVADRAIAVGERLAPEHLREIAWPLEELPEGAHKRIDGLLSGEGPVFARAPVPALLPVIDRDLVDNAALLPPASRLAPGRRAMAVRLDESMLAGQQLRADDRIDILMSHPASGGGSAYVDVILQDIRVLSLEQRAEGARPDAKRALTLEVTTAQAQVLTLAMRTGQLSFILRGAESPLVEPSRRLTLDEILGRPEAPEQPAPPPAEPQPISAPAPEPVRPATTSIRVNRNGGRTEYDVHVSP